MAQFGAGSEDESAPSISGSGGELSLVTCKPRRQEGSGHLPDQPVPLANELGMESLLRQVREPMREMSGVRGTEICMSQAPFVSSSHGCNPVKDKSRLDDLLSSSLIS